MRFLFIHAGYGQFGPLHEHINSVGEHQSWFLCSQGVFASKKEKVPNLIPFADPGETDGTFFYLKRIEQRVRRSFHLRKSVMSFLDEHEIDVIITHGSGGFPLQMFDDVDVPIVTYIEFPSFKAYGFDEKYPPPEALVFRDRLFEMYSFHEAMRSDLVVTPSEHARRMFPEFIRHKIVAQMDGMKVPPPGDPTPSTDGLFRIGFVARDLSSAKGVEHFIKTAKAIHAVRPESRFLILGSKEMRYSYEDAYTATLPDVRKGIKFLDYLFQREGIDPGDGIFQHTEYLPYEEFVQFFDSLDVIHYPLQFGSANWGLFEAMFRERVIIGSDRCFVPEVLRDGETGYICRYGDIDQWVRRTIEIMDAPDRGRQIGMNARREALARFDVAAVAKRYVEIAHKAIANKRFIAS